MVNTLNRLQHESSLYLQQHASNPVNWYPWSNEAFEIAKEENKPIFLSIGYSSCHWCHVMEEEVFEDEQVAAFLNQYFVSIKVDREERPDIDNVYMTAVQLMTQKGGWPLNCVTLPDGRPIFGGTYFPKDQFLNVLSQIVNLFQNDKQKVEEYASHLEEGIKAVDFTKPAEETELRGTQLHLAYLKWEANFDKVNGGTTGVPKFPLPNNYEFLLQYGRLFEEKPAVEHTHLTLLKIIRGGIYDQIEGGLMRYSTDAYWKIPHFEKMLYDNAQFLSVLSSAHMDRPEVEYEMAIRQTAQWLQTVMRDGDGFYKSAIDADSEIGEGEYYVWRKEKLQSLLLGDYTKVEDLYQINSKGFWQEGRYLPLRNESISDFAKKHDMSVEECIEWKQTIDVRLNDVRQQRIAPIVDTKIICSWNCMLVIGWIDAAVALSEKSYFDAALSLALKIEERFVVNDKLTRIHTEQNTIWGFLDDYAFFIKMCIKIHQYTLDNQWLQKAIDWLGKTENVFDKQDELFYYSELDAHLLSNTVEVNDNVIPASNSVLANCYWDLGVLNARPEWLDTAKSMLICIYEQMESYPSGYSNWAILLQKVIKSDLCIAYFSEIDRKHHLDNLRKLHDLVLFKFDEVQSEKPETYQICHRQHCFLPKNGWNKMTEEIHDILG